MPKKIKSVSLNNISLGSRVEPAGSASSASSVKSPQEAKAPSSTSPDPEGDRLDTPPEHSSSTSLPLPPPRSPLGLAQSPTGSSLPRLPSPPEPLEATSEQSKTLFMNYKASKSSSRLQPSETIRQISNTDLARSASSESQIYKLRHNSGSSPDLTTANNVRGSEALAREESDSPHPVGRRPVGTPVRSHDSVPDSRPSQTQFKKNKPKPFAHFLNRTRSIRIDPASPSFKTSTPKTSTHRFAEPENATRKGNNVEATGLKTAPPGHEGDKSFRDMMNSTIRNRSADRQNTTTSEDGSAASLKEHPKHASTFSSSFRDGTGAALLSNLKTSSTKAADGLGKAGKGIFGKLTRSGSGGEKEFLSDENYVCSVINLPLVEQTRRTRIGKRLEHSKDKTEFWMPALPWRCIDYLNYKGCEEEGLYRIPGSGPRVKEWQRRFDTEFDINLFDEPDLYDINIIGSMFKAWLRQLPDEIFPKETQERIAKKCMGATEVPQMLKDELSKLPPFNYYLLFAITCHLSLLHSYVDKNKMDYRNLCICFQPCLRMDGFCFQFLVCAWKQCWQGCWTEKDALVEEYRVLDGIHPSSAGGSTEGSQDVIDERAISSSDSSQPPTAKERSLDKPRPPPLKRLNTDEKRASPSDQTNNRSTTSADGPQQLPSIEPMVPLSPLGI
ncbi:MAG: hypothetical protein M1837_006545 [Sclerophora amabilis]|nr:MAG: hypothetical protein M1837_006545 [Sclerophora amabilis]